MIVSYKMDYETTTEKITLVDTVQVFDPENPDTSEIKIVKSEQTVEKYIWAEDYKKKFKEDILPFVNAAKQDGLKVRFVAGSATPEMLASFKKELNAPFECFDADDILVKTIVRSNPGILLWKDGVLVNKWHHKQLPSYEDVKSEMQIK